MMLGHTHITRKGENETVRAAMERKKKKTGKYGLTWWKF